MLLDGFFYTGDTAHLAVLNQTYNSILVLLSYVIAVLASYVFLDIAGKLKDDNSLFQNKRWWFITGAFVMGTGIWSMHFTGMLALNTPMPMHYSFGYTLASVVIAVLASGCALYLIMTVKRLQLRHFIFGGILLGIAISMMHYLGMEAMKVHTNIQYVPSLFALSILVGIVASVIALWLAQQSTEGTFKHKLSFKLFSALIMGIAICGMHYTGMAAALIQPFETMQNGHALSSETLSIYIAMAEMLIIGIMIFASTYSQLVTNPLIAKLQAQNEELLHIKDSLEKSKIEADNANKIKSTFLANMSHELRTPLNAIIGYSELMLEESDGDPKNSKVSDLTKVISSAKHLLNLINDILDLSKIEAGKMQLFLEDIDIVPFLYDIKVMAQPLIEKNNNKFELSVPEDIGKMRVDVTRLRQCILNLLSNASKFTNNGLLKLSVERMVQNEESWIQFTMTDTGIGMTDDQLKHLFQAFTQADLSTTRKFGGTGLGLFLTKSFSDMLGGNISVESTYGKGSTFILKIPSVCNEELAVNRQKEKIETAKVTKLIKPTILIIDDDPVIHKSIEDELGGASHYSMLHAYESEKGYKMAKEFKPDIIILDIILPGGNDGWSLLSTLKSDPSLRNTYIILISILPNKDLGIALGAIDYFQKPLDFDHFNQRVRELITILHIPRIMIVDDDPAMRQLLAHSIEKLAAIPIEASNGREALERLKHCKPSLILLDLLMPEMDGFDFINTVQKDESLRNIPIIIITSKDLTNEERAELTSHSQQILKKSFGVRKIISHICEDINHYIEESKIANLR